MIGRLAREFGSQPLKLALEYGRVSQGFYDGLSPDRRILIDHHILNRMIQADNEAMEKQRKDGNNRMPLDDHPGMVGKRRSVEEALALAAEKKREAVQ